MKVRHVDWYPDEWLSGTAELTAVERGVYVTICSLIYSRGGPIRGERRELSRLCNIHGNALNRTMERLITLGKIVENGPEISVKRCGIELEKARNRHGKALENGEKGGRPSKKINGIEKPDGFQDEKLTNQPTNLEEVSKEKDDANASSKNVTVDGGSNGRAYRLPTDWQPSPENLAFCTGLGLDPARVIPEYVDYWGAEGGQRARKTDWQKTFRNRCRQLADAGRGNAGRGPRNNRPGAGSLLAALDLLSSQGGTDDQN